MQMFGRIGRQQCVVDKIDLGYTVLAALCDVDVEVSSGYLLGSINITEVQLNVVFMYLVVIGVDFVLDDNHDVIEGEPVIHNPIIVDVVRDELDVAGTAWV